MICMNIIWSYWMSNLRNRSKKQRLFIDCTSTTRTNITSGVQRVVKQFLDGVPNLAMKLELEVIPVCAQFGNYYTLDEAIDMTIDTVGHYQPIQFSYNDIYFCPDAFWSCEIFKWYDYFDSKGVIIVTMIYDLIPLDPRGFTSSQDRTLFRTALEVIIRHSSLLLAPTFATKEQLLEYVKEQEIESPPEVKTARIAPIFWGEPHESNTIDNEEIDSSNGFLLMVGTIEKRRGYLETIEALSKYWDKQGDLELKIVGKVADEVIAEKINGYHDSGYPVEILTTVNDKELYSLYKSANAIICSSMSEGYGLSVAEGLLINGKVLANKLPVFGEFAGSMPYYFDINDPRQLVELVSNLESLTTVINPSFLEWEDCYDELVGCLASISPFHEINVNFASSELNRAFVYHTFITLGLGEPDIEALGYWTEGAKNAEDFLKMIYYEASQNTNDLSIYYIYQVLGLGSPDEAKIEFWKSNFPNIKDFISEAMLTSSNNTTDLAVYYVYKAFGLSMPDKEACNFWKERCPEISDFITQLQEFK